MGGKECQFATELYPIFWPAYTLVRGALVKDRTGRNCYLYPLLDVKNGYARVAVNIVLAAVLFFVPVPVPVLVLGARR